jgi:DNA-binding transcriptional ArsR family regulator
MAPVSGPDSLLILFEALAPEERADAYERIRESYLREQEVEDTEMVRHVRSLSRVAEAVGHFPGVDEYRHVSRVLRAEGETDVEPFSQLYKFFNQSWPQAREALQIAGETSARVVEARFRNRKLGKIARYTEDVLRDTLARATEHYGRPPSTEEFEWWRERQIELARAQGEEYPHVPSNSCYRVRWKTWEGALLHFGYTPEEVARRLEAQDQVFNGNADPYLPDDLPVAELAAEIPEGLPLSAHEAESVRKTYQSFPRRTRYVLTVRLGLGISKQTLRDAAEPLALHLTRIQQLQRYAMDELVLAASDGRKETRPGFRAAVIETLRLMSRVPE